MRTLSRRCVVIGQQDVEEEGGREQATKRRSVKSIIKSVDAGTRSKFRVRLSSDFVLTVIDDHPLSLARP